MNMNAMNVHQEKVVRAANGWLMLPLVLGVVFGSIALFIYALVEGTRTQGHPLWLWFVVSILSEIVGIVLLTGFFTLQPNEGRVLLLFGAYEGTERESGFHWGNPFYSNGCRLAVKMDHGHAKIQAVRTGKLPRNKISLRVRTLNGEKLKVNDKRGNPVEIGAVVMWRVHDTAQAFFDVDDFEQYVQTQSESALRHLASRYSYDHGEENECTLRSNVEEVSGALRQELQDRLGKAGVAVEEARLTHLAYAPEIAQAMLRRQQAEAVIDARQKIVHGAVSMVDMALKSLAEKHVVQLDDERKAAMVSNLMVVLCGESEVHPVVNTGTLYS
jgi:regulator of protease activity HflC (stomatin/prohibitin superfamily)